MLTSLMELRKLKLSSVIFVFLSLVFNPFLVHTSGFSQDRSNSTEILTISSVEISGNRRIETELIELNIKTKPGEQYSLEKVREDLKQIYRLGYFENVYIETEKKNGEIGILYVVDEKPVIVDLRISGNDDVKDKDIQEVMQIREGEIIDLKKVDSSLNAIRDLYMQRGFVDTSVDYEIEPEGDGTVTLTYNISEGKTAYIKKVNFVGNENIKSKVIKKRVYSRPKGLLSFITKKGLYNIDEIEKDKERIRAVYLDSGYLDVNVSNPEITYLEGKEGYEIRFNIQEGSQYKVESVSFEGDFVESPESFEEVIRLKPGDIFSSAKISADIASLTTYFGNQGFAFANVAPRFVLNKEELLVQISYQIERGNKVYVRYIDIVGNLHTRDQVIRREIRQQEQSLYSSKEVDLIRARVARLGYFENNVEVDQNRVAGTDDLLDILVKVSERPTGFFSIAGGVSSVEKFIFAAQVRENNLFGYGKSLLLNAQIGGITQIASLNYADPNFIGTDYTFDISVFYNDREFRDFDRGVWGGTFGFGKLLYKDLSARIAYRLENLDISDVSRGLRLLIIESNRTISSFVFSLIWDNRNNLLDPTSGNLSSSTIEYAGPFGGDTDFIKYTLSIRHWVPLWYGTFVTFRGLYGLLDLKNAGNDLIIGERFFLGGPHSLRGFGFRRVGPRIEDPENADDYVIIGGVQQLLLSADYVFPILPSAGLRGVVFFDVGNVFNDGEKLTFNPSGLRKNFGAGIRWISPLGPLRLEIGIPVDRLPDEDSFEVQFTMGSIF